MDLIYYDNPDYYDTYVFVANNADHMIEGAVVISSKIFGGIVALLVAASLIMTINPFLAVFPIVGFIVNLITRFKMEEIEYTWSEEKPIIQSVYSISPSMPRNVNLPT